MDPKLRIALVAVVATVIGGGIVMLLMQADTGPDVAPYASPVLAEGPAVAVEAPPTPVSTDPAAATEPAAEPAGRKRRTRSTGGEPPPPKAEDDKPERVPTTKVEEGYEGFGLGVCERQKQCGCQEFEPEVCMRRWWFVTPNDYQRGASCLLDLECESLCNFSDLPKDHACRAVVDRSFGGD